MPSGAGGLPAVKPLPLAAMPERLGKDQGEPVGWYRYWPAPTDTCSKPRSAAVAMQRRSAPTASMRAVLSPPAVLSPRNPMVCDPAATLKAAVV